MPVYWEAEAWLELSEALLAEEAWLELSEALLSEAEELLSEVELLLWEVEDSPLSSGNGVPSSRRAPLANSAAWVAGSAMPVASRPLAVWNRLTQSAVVEPYMPS